MGVNASSYPHSCSPRFGGSSQTQQTFIGSRCFALTFTGHNYLDGTSYSPQGYGCEGKLYSLEGGGGSGSGGGGGGGGERPHDRKKKSSGLATLKRRFIKRRKSSRSADHARQLRELLSGWDVRDAHALVEEYEGTAALKELSLAAGLARPHARTLQRDLAELYRLQLCADVELLFQDTRFPAHRALLAARCPFLGSLLASGAGVSVGIGSSGGGGGVSPGGGGPTVILDVGAAAGAAGVGLGMDAGVFSALLYYLYTGELGGEETRLRSGELLLRLGEEFGTPNSLEADMRALWERMSHHDSVLCFASDAELEAVPSGGGGGGGVGGALGGGGGVSGAPSPMGGPGACASTAAAAAAATAAVMLGEDELRAHKAVLSARSPFFRSLLQRRTRAGAGPAGEEQQPSSLGSSCDPHTPVGPPPLPTCIVLDESIIPKKYARVILHCMYTDRVELSLVLRGSPSAGSLGEVQALVAGRGGGMTRAEEAMELYHIALFLEFSMLAQARQTAAVAFCGKMKIMSSETRPSPSAITHPVSNQQQQHKHQPPPAPALLPDVESRASGPDGHN
ncbi:hypothetical protein ACEWY4_021832 [Coilia grayii]|uniref:BTB domain-containing protein n=1 Tax=Coilia grayii TaxID=363190 RepID=A0ABD1J5A6_9TELE